MTDTKQRGRSFTDVDGVTRTIEINPFNVQAIHNATGVDLTQLLTSETAANQLAENMAVTANVIAILAFPPEMADVEKVRLLADNDVFPRAVDAFLLAAGDFAPRKARNLFKRAFSAPTA